MKHALAACLLMLSLTACTPGTALSFLTGGGPNVAANVQAGKTNTQTLGTTSNVEQTLVRPQARSIEQSTGYHGVRAETVDTVHVTNMDPWVLILIVLLAGFLIPSPQEIARGISSWFSKKEYRTPTS